MKKIKLPCFNIVVELDEKDPDNPDLYIGGNISSDLHEKCPVCGADNCYRDCPRKFNELEDEDEMEERLDFNKRMDALESIILAHACAGIDISSPAYVEGVETAVESCANNI